MSARDAIYCAKFIQTITALNIPYFKPLIIFDKIFLHSPHILSSRTTDESLQFGRFLDRILQLTNSWTDKKKFLKECDSPPFYIKERPMEYAQYCKIHRKWHERLTAFFVASLKSEDYISSNNTFKVLRQLSKVYPVFKMDLGLLEEEVKKVTQNLTLVDLSTVAKAYLNILGEQKEVVSKREEVVEAKEEKKEEKREEVYERKRTERTPRNERSDERGSPRRVRRDSDFAADKLKRRKLDEGELKKVEVRRKSPKRSKKNVKN